MKSVRPSSWPRRQRRPGTRLRSPSPTRADLGPIRTCVGCRRRRPQAELVRVAIDPSGAVAMGRHLPGRGAWLCRDTPSCLDGAVRKGGLARALHTSLDADAYAVLRTSLERWAENRPDMRE